jgi:hypothetical protein
LQYFQFGVNLTSAACHPNLQHGKHTPSVQRQTNGMIKMPLRHTERLSLHEDLILK